MSGISNITKERPIIMSVPMVRALLAGEKTQTRRIIKPQPEIRNGGYYWDSPKIKITSSDLDPCITDCYCPYGQPGDLLWVRESFQMLKSPTICPGEILQLASIVQGKPLLYRADATTMNLDDWGKWRPSIHMPRWASRLTLELTEVRVERLQDISEMDAYAEGIDAEGDVYLAAEHGKLGGASGPAASVCAYADLWDSIHGPGSWDANPWVWALSFKVHQCNIDAFKARKDAA